MDNFMQNQFMGLARLGNGRTKRESSWDRTGRNQDYWVIKGGESRVIADIKGPGCITHIWMTQACPEGSYFRKILLKMYWDGEKNPSVLAPLGDFFCLGHSIANSFCSLPLSASCNRDNENVPDGRAALNCYLAMPFNRSARIELVNESKTDMSQYFYVDYELYDKPHGKDIAYFHACWNRENPCDGWGHEIKVNTPEANIVNLAGRDNYVMLKAKGRGHYIGCNLSVTNFQGTWWGEGDDMIFIDGEKWPPSLHGTGSEDYLNHAWGMQDNRFLYNGSSIFEYNTGGYQTSYDFHIVNPVRFRKDIKVTIEHGHANHLANECSSTAYWYQQEPHVKFGILPVNQRIRVAKDFVKNRAGMTPQKKARLNREMLEMKKKWKEKRS